MMYAFNAISPTKQYDFEDLTLEDMVKALPHARKQTAVYSLLLVAHHNKAFDERYKLIETYPQIERFLRTHGTAQVRG